MTIDARALSGWLGTGPPAVEEEPHRHGASTQAGARYGPSSNSAALSLLALLAGPSMLSQAAEQPTLPDELAVTDSIVMTERDELYVSPTIQYFRLPDQKRLTFSSEVAYGFTDRVQLTTQLPYAVVTPDGGRTTSGIGDVAVTARYGLLNYRERPFGLDVGLGLKLPTGDNRRDLGEGRVSLEPSFTASTWLGGVNAQANGSWRHAFGSGAEPTDEGEYNVAFVYPIRRWFLVLEGDGESSREGTKYYVTPELVWKVERLELRLAVPAAVTDAAGSYAIVAGCTVEFEHLFHRTEDN